MSTPDPGARRLLAMVLDDVGGTMSAHFTDGSCVTEALELGLPSSSVVARSIWVPGLARLVLVTTTGDEVTVELPAGDDLCARAGRPTIYLDQNQWSVLAKTIYRPERVDEGSREAARRLIDLVRAGKVILPLSGAHMVETCQWGDDRSRYELALTMAQLSCGWQVRDPLQVRRFELVDALRVSAGWASEPAPEVVTLAPDAALCSAVIPGPSLRVGGAPDDWAEAFNAVFSVSSVFDAMLSGHAIDRVPVPGWSRRLQGFADWLGSESTGRELRRARTELFFLADLGDELPHAAFVAGVTPDEMSDWVTNRLEQSVARLPALGLFREAVHDKLVNTGARWEENDLFDLMYLTCAAGYADYVVAERHWAAMMRQGLRRLGRPVNIHTRLPDLVDDLGGLEDAA